MKNIALVIFLFFAFGKLATAQINLGLQLNFQPDPDPREWPNQAGLLVVTTMNTTNETFQFKYKGRMTLNGETVMDNDINQMPVETIGPFDTEIREVQDVLPPNALSVYGDLRKTYIKTGQIPAGNYLVCAQIFDLQNKPLSVEMCAPMLITAYQQPSLIFPANDMILNPDVPPNFSWTPVVPVPAFPVTYLLRVAEVPLDGTQSVGVAALQAFNYGYPLIEVELPNVTQWQWTPDFPELEEGKTYVWGVQALNENNVPIGENAGTSNLFTFHVKKNTLRVTGDCSDVISFTDFSWQTVTYLPTLKKWKLNIPNWSHTKLANEIDGKVVHLRYFIDPGDGTGYKGGMGMNAHHEYSEQGQYDIKAKIVAGFYDKFNDFQPYCEKELIKTVTIGSRTLDTPTEINSPDVEDCTPKFNFRKTGSDVWEYHFKDETQLSPPSLKNKNKSTDSYIATWTINGDTIHSGDIFEFDYTFPQEGSYKVCLEIDTWEKPDPGAAQERSGLVDLCTKEFCKTIQINDPCLFAETSVDCDFSNPVNLSAGDEISLSGNLMMKLISVSGNSSNLSGSGKIYIPWLLTDVEVSFSGIKVNEQMQFCSGEIWAVKDPNAPTYPEQWGINVAMSSNMTEELIKEIDEFVEDNFEIDPGLGDMAEEQVAPVKVPLGINNANGYSAAFTAFQFTPTRNRLSAVMMVDLDFYDNHNLGFEATNITFTSAGPINPAGQGGSGGLELIGDKTIYYSAWESGPDPETLSFTFRKKSGNRLGTGFKWTSECGEALNWCFRVDADFTLPRRWVLPIPDDGVTHAGGNIFTEVCNWKDWIVTANLPKCEIVNTNGLEVEITSLTFDHSEMRNAEGMVFPAQYAGDKTETFTGFWLKQGKLILPEELTTYSDPTRRIELQLNNWIIDKATGFSGQVTGSNIVNFPDGNVADLGASIDKIEVNFVNNSLTTAFMEGEVLLPVSKEDDPDYTNKLDYKALFGTGNYGSYNGFQFILKPDPAHPIRAELLGKGELQLHQNSSFVIQLKSNESKFDLKLNSTLAI